MIANITYLIIILLYKLKLNKINILNNCIIKFVYNSKL